MISSCEQRSVAGKFFAGCVALDATCRNVKCGDEVEGVVGLPITLLEPQGPHPSQTVLELQYLPPLHRCDLRGGGAGQGCTHSPQRIFRRSGRRGV